MNSAQLLERINEVNQPSDILTRLNEAHFAVNEITDDGDSVLHVLAKSNHAKNYNFSDFISILMDAGADVNTVDKQGKGFLSYYLENGESWIIHKTFYLLLEHKDFNTNIILLDDLTFFEYLYNASDYSLRKSLETLLVHVTFDPNQNTSKHNSILLHMLSEKSFNHEEWIYALIEHVNMNPNIKNNNGQTALAQYLADHQYKDMRLISALVDHKDCEINTLDQDGNNYLHLAIMYCEYQSEEIAELLLNKGINVSHRTNEGKSIFELISDNIVNRSDYSNIKLQLDILKFHPVSLFEPNTNGTTILGELLRSDEYSITSEFSNLLKRCNSLPDHSLALKEIISDIFNDYCQKLVSDKTLGSIIDAIGEANITFDTEYCLALIATNDPDFTNKRLFKSLRAFKPEANLDMVMRHVKNLTKEHSVEQERSLNFIGKIGMKMDCFDSEILLWEEQYLRKKRNPDLVIDTKMLGHLFSLSGSIPANNQLMELTSSTTSDTAPFLTHLMNAYVSHCESLRINSKHLDAIRQVRNMTIKAMRFYFLSRSWEDYYPSLKSSADAVFSSVITDSKNSGVELFTGWDGHAVNLIIKQDDLYRNNGGGCSTDATTEHYKITKPEHLSEDMIAKLYNDENEESNKSFIQHELHDLLGLKLLSTDTGKFQTVGNCSLESKLIALKQKYRLFLAEAIADELFEDTIQFFKHFYLEEYLSLHSNNSTLPYVLMRLIIQKLIPEAQLDLASTLLKKHFTSEAAQEMLQTELMLKQWKIQIKGKSPERFLTQLNALGVTINPAMNARLQMLDNVLNNKITSDDLENLKSWSLDEQSFQGYHLLHLAVMNNNVALASSLIKIVPKAINQSNWYAQEPLCLVTSLEMIDTLVKAGASIDSTDDDNALDHAILANEAEWVGALLRHGAKPSKYSAYYAADMDPQILDYLIEFHPETILKKTHSYSTAAHAAAGSGNNGNLKTLAYYGGVNLAARDVNGVTPLQLALKNGHDDTAKFLIEYPGTLFKAPYRGDSVINMAQNDEIKQMVQTKKKERKADLNYFERFKNSNPGVVEEDMDYLIIAIIKNDLSAIRGCLLAYPNIKVVNNSNLYCTSPLARAMQNLAGKKGQQYEDAFEIVQLLLKTPGIDINAVMASTEPMLFMATSINDVLVLELFLADPKLNPNKQDDIGYTALHDAVERGHLECVKRLLQDDRVDSTVLNKRNQTAADLKGFRADTRECREEVVKHQQKMQINKSESSLKR